jgi:hypothetical protein
LTHVTFIDTSVLCELLNVPGKNERHETVLADFKSRDEAGEQFVVPITAAIETGNHIAHAEGDRRTAAERFVDFILKASKGDSPFIVNTTEWDGEFLNDLCNGSDGRPPFVDLAGNRQLGAGDIAILVERNRFRSSGSFERVEIWTLDQALASYS